MKPKSLAVFFAEICKKNTAKVGNTDNMTRQEVCDNISD